jgi:hypothetical protein
MPGSECYTTPPSSSPILHSELPAIALGSVAEVKCLVELTAEMGYLPAAVTRDLMDKANRSAAVLYGLKRKLTAHQQSSLVSRLSSLVSRIAYPSTFPQVYYYPQGHSVYGPHTPVAFCAPPPDRRRIVTSQ